MSVRQQRTSLPESLGDLWRRVQILEALTGGGLQFNSGAYGPHNLGDWLEVTADGVNPFGFAIKFISTGDGGIALTCDDDGPIEIKTNGDGGILLESNGDGDFVLRQNGSSTIGIEIVTNDDGPLNIHSEGLGDFNLHAAGGNMLIDTFGGDITITTGGNLILGYLPTSPAGLPTGALWNNLGIVTIV